MKKKKDVWFANIVSHSKKKKKNSDPEQAWWCHSYFQPRNTCLCLRKKKGHKSKLEEQCERWWVRSCPAVLVVLSDRGSGRGQQQRSLCLVGHQQSKGLLTCPTISLGKKPK